MRLRHQVLIIIGVITAVAMVVVYQTVAHLLVNSYQRLEDEITVENAVRARNTLYHELEILSLAAGDWAGREDSYTDFTGGQGDSRYQQHSLKELRSQGIEVIGFLHEGTTRLSAYALSKNKRSENKLQLTPASAAQLGKLSRLVAPGVRQTQGDSGFFKVEDQIWLYSLKDVRKTLDAADPLTSLIFARKLTPAYLRQLSAVFDQPINLDTLSELSSSGVTATPDVWVERLSYTTNKGIFYLYDFAGQPIAVGSVSHDRNLSMRAMDLTNYLVTLLFMIGLMIAGVSQVMVSKMVISRVLRLRARAQSIADSGMAVGRVEVSGKDELTELAEDFNKMIETLGRTQQQLEEAKENAEAANNAKSGFLANMSHEIRTPMTAILGYADLLQMDELSQQERSKYIQTLRENGQQLMAILNDILDLSKIEAGKMTVNRQSVELLTLLEAVIALMKVNAQQKDLTVKLEFSGPIPRKLVTDAVRLRQILLNLLGNAIKFTCEGEIVLLVDYKPELKRVELSVSDTGIGMSEQQLLQSFQAFNQVDNSSTRQYGGTGLGLAICRQLAHLLGGDLQGHSKIDEGSRFTLSLPVGLDTFELIDASRYSSESPVSKDNDSKFPALSGCVLLVEDNPVVRVLVSKMLQNFGLKAFCVENGKQACEALVDEGLPVQLVFMDMHMPVMDGFAATRYLRQHAYDGTIIALTANAMSGDRERCLSIGCDDFLAKPVDLQKFYQTCQRFLPAGKAVCALDNQC